MEKLKKIALLFIILVPWLVKAQQSKNVICRDTAVCFDSQSFLLNLCSPLGGIYSGSIFINAEGRFEPIGNSPAYYLTYTVNSEVCPVTIFIKKTPTYGTIYGDVKVCKGETVRYNATGIKNAESYVWDFNANTYITNIPQLDLLFRSNDISTSLTVRGRNNACEDGSADSSIFPISVITNPTTSIQGKNPVCKNEQATYTATSGLAKYKWSLTSEDGLISGYDTSITVKVAWTNKDISILKLRVWNVDGCYSDTLLKVTKGAGTAPNPSEIWQFGYNLLVCSDSTSGITYQWFNNNDPKSTLSYYYCPDTDIDGEIYVKTSNGSCSSESPKIKVSKQPGGLKANSIVSMFSIYPNPVSDKLIIRRMVPESEKFSYRLLDLYGKQQLAGYGTGLESGIDVSGLSAGVYFIRIDNGQSGTETYKIIKNR
jgi:hypothetical protein